MASSAANQDTGKEQAGSTDYLKRHYFEAIFKEGWSFSGFERDKVYLNRCDGTYFDASGLSGADSPSDGRGTAFADYDNDGDSDIFVHTIQGSQHLLFRNDAGARGGHLRVELEGRRSNRGGVGAVVTVSAGGRKLARIRSAGSGYLSTHDPRLLFGLGAASTADRVEIAWPSGEMQVLEKVPAGSSIRVTEGEPGFKKVAYRKFRFADAPPEPPDQPLLLTGDPIPDLVLSDLDGKEQRLHGALAAGKPMLVNFWATWCVPCQHEMPELERMAKKFGDRAGVLGISLDVEERAAVKPFLEKMGIHYPVLLAGKDTPTKVFQEDKVLLPASFLVGPDRRIKGVFVGGKDETLRRLEAELEKLAGR